MGAELHDITEAVAGRLEEEHYFADVPDLMKALRDAEREARHRYAREVAEQLELALTSLIRDLRFDQDDVTEMMGDIRDALDHEDRPGERLARVLADWVTTGLALRDDDVRETLTGGVVPDDMVPADRPE